MVSILLTLNRFIKLCWCVYCWLWVIKSWLCVILGLFLLQRYLSQELCMNFILLQKWLFHTVSLFSVFEVQAHHHLGRGARIFQKDYVVAVYGKVCWKLPSFIEFFRVCRRRRKRGLDPCISWSLKDNMPVFLDDKSVLMNASSILVNALSFLTVQVYLSFR